MPRMGMRSKNSNDSLNCDSESEVNSIDELLDAAVKKPKKPTKHGGKSTYQQFVLEPWEEDNLRGTKRKKNPNRMNSL